MAKDIKDSAGLYEISQPTVGLASEIRLRFDRGTLILENCPQLPEALANYFRYDPRVDAHRAPAYHYRRILASLKAIPILYQNQAPRYRRLKLDSTLSIDPYPHQQEALTAWKSTGGCGVVVLPTGAGKSLLGLLALTWSQRDGLVLVPTIDLMHQWYALLKAAFPQQEIGLLGGGYRDILAVTIATYDSASRHSDRLGNRFGLLIFDEVHHLPSEFYRCIAEFSLASYRLGLTATLERSDGKHQDLMELVGPTVYSKHPQELVGQALAPFQIRPWRVDLSSTERQAYQQAMDERNAFLHQAKISLGSLAGWNRFVMVSARSAAGRRAMQAHRQARRIAQATPAKLRALDAILTSHPAAKTVIFTEDNATAYEVSQRFLIPCITHQTLVKERQFILESFRDGLYRAVVTSKALNEGVDVPDAQIGVILSGSSTAREFIQRLGRILRRSQDKQAILYEVITRETQEERVAERRRQSSQLQPGETFALFNDEISDDPK